MLPSGWTLSEIEIGFVEGESPVGSARNGLALPPELPVSWGLPLAQRVGCGGCTRAIRYTNPHASCLGILPINAEFPR